MKKLYHLLGTIDENATKAFIELQKHQLAVRRSVSEWLELHRRPQTAERDKDMAGRITVLSRFLPEPVKAQEFLTKFSIHLLRDAQLLQGMETIVRPDISCKDCADTTSLVLKKLGQPVMTNLYYNTVKMLLERISSVMVDHQALKLLVGYIEDCLKGGNLIEEVGLHPNTAGERGLKLLVMLSFVFPCHFLHEDVLRHLASFLTMDDETVAPLVLSVLTFLGKYKPIGELFGDLMRELVPICKQFAITGTTKQAKQAIRCLYVNLANGQDAIVKELLVKESGITSDLLCNDVEWCKEDELPEETRCKLEGLKTMARWLLGLKADELSAQKTFRMLNAFIVNRGDLLQQGKLSKGIPNNRCLPLDFMGYYALAGPTEKGMGQLAHILPDYMLVFAVPVLAHDPDFTAYDDVEQLTRKLWAVCDLAMGLVLSKTTNYEMKEFPADTRVPTMYFRRHEDTLWVNAKSYLPPDMQIHAPKMKPGLSMVESSVGAKLVTRGTKVRGRNAKQQQGVGINETDVKEEGMLECIDAECGSECDEPPAKRAALDQHKLEPM
ncbi:hypothetical protein C0J52_15180 [Blattella germanica]|nr:hypothetical protein C0J52_15180 [Blattella germanica]